MYVIQRRANAIHLGRRFGNFVRRWLAKVGLVAVGIVIGAGLVLLRTGA